ncbi:MAG: hypothetical protein NVS4B11_15720 [Ktedonobacteraceae bacterium]
MALQIGQVLASRYRILSFAGYGGMASTYIAEDLNSSTRVRIETFQVDRTQ